MKLRNPKLKNWLDKWPGKKYLAEYRFLPLFFILGAALEFSMINWNVGEVNFYKVYKRNQAKSIVESEILEEKFHL